MMKMGSFVKFRHLDPLKLPQMTRNPLYFLMTSSVMQEVLHFEVWLLDWRWKVLPENGLVYRVSMARSRDI